MTKSKNEGKSNKKNNKKNSKNKKKIVKRIFGGILAVIGFLLSPISWWNDLVVNIPLSYLFAIPFGAINKSLFLPMFIIGYWLTNITGFVMMHQGIKQMTIKKLKKRNIKKELRNMMIVSILYTILILILVLTGILKFPTEYLPK